MSDALSADGRAFQSTVLESGVMHAAFVALGLEPPSPDTDRAEQLLHSVQQSVRGLPEAIYLVESTAYHSDLEAAAKKCMNLGILAQGERIALASPMNWSQFQGKPRNVRYKAHAWGVLDAILAHDTQSQDEGCYRAALEHALDWITTYVVQTTVDEFTWYDMAVGQRATKLAYLLRRAIRHAEPAEVIAKLVVACHLHLLELSDPARVAMHSNHGLFQMAGALALAHSLPFIVRAPEARTFGTTSIQTMLNNHFGPDGLHLEHSPMYHIFMTNYVSLLMDSGFLDQSPELLNMANAAIEAAQWFVMPDGQLLPFGDTPRIPADERAHFPLLTTPRSPNMPMGVRWFQHGGLVVQRSQGLQGKDDTYLAFNGGFHSRQHKHADDFNVQLHARGVALLDDPGTFTYQYDDPRRMYIESTRAHSCLEIDGLNSSRYNNDAYGSSIKHVHSLGPALYMEGFIHRKRLITSALPNNRISGSDAIQVNVMHTRRLFHLPNEFLLVIDELKSSNEHEYTQHFHLNHRLSVDLAGEARLTLDGEHLASIVPLSGTMANLKVTKGQERPTLHGWSSIDGHTLVPSPVVSNTEQGANRVLASLIDLCPDSKSDVFFNEGTSGKYLRLVVKRGKKQHEFVYRKSGMEGLLKFIQGQRTWEATLQDEV